VIIPVQSGAQNTGPAEPGNNMFYIYQITNPVTRKIYVGYTSSRIENRWEQHKKQALKETSNRKFYNAIRKYGTEIWEVSLLSSAPTVSEAKEKEIYYIELFNSYYEGYNSTKGGDGNNGIVMSKESNQKRSESLLGRKKSEETIKKFKARKQTETTREAISKAHLGMKKPWVKWEHQHIVKRALTRRSLSKEQFDEIHRMRGEGISLLDISKCLGCSYDIVKKWAKRSWDIK
jgi:group I intron endonuclease